MLVATAYDKNLYWADVAYAVDIATLSARDSAIVVQTYIDKWVRDQVVVVEAEKYIAADLDIDRLVDDYRSSLLSYNYEKRLVEDQLDTVITPEDYQEYYNREADQLTLSEPIMTYQVITVPAKARRIDRFFTDWRAGRQSAIDDYATKYATSITYDTTTYLKKSDVLSNLPSKFRKKRFKKNARIVAQDNGVEYFVTIVDYYSTGEKPPLSYIKNTLRKRILHQRKLQLIASIKDNLYQIAVANNKVKINQPSQ